jgi:hypothetical protein
MNLKGRTTIQIRDAETGVIKEELTDDNLVTDAVSHVLNGALNCLMNTSNNGLQSRKDWSEGLAFSEGFAKDLFGGVLIFDSAITEEASHVIPTTAEMDSFIGCGCQDASLAGDKFRGSLNAQETVIGDDFCKFVWDFSTAQANGDIAAICLTSNAGGAVGFKQNVSSSTPTEHNTIKAVSDSDPESDSGSIFARDNGNTGRWGLTTLSTGISDRHGVMFNNKRLAQVYDGKIYYKDTSNVQEYFIHLTSKNDQGKVNNSDSYEEISLSEGYDHWIQVLDNGHYCYTAETDFDFTYDDSNINDFKIHRYDPTGSEVVYTLNLKPFVENLQALFSTQSASIDSVCKFIFDNKLYFIVPYIGNTSVHPNLVRVYCMDLTDDSGEYTMHETQVSQVWLNQMSIESSVDWTRINTNPFEVCSLLGEIYFGVNEENGARYNYSRIDSSSLEFDGDNTNYSWCDSPATCDGFGVLNTVPWASSPWLGTRVDGTSLEGGTIFGNLVLFTPYLATINNISKVLTKTAADTMKIIYTITRTSNS